MCSSSDSADADVLSAMNADAGRWPWDWFGDDHGAVGAGTAGFHHAFGAYDGVRFGNERDAQESRQD